MPSAPLRLRSIPFLAFLALSCGSPLSAGELKVDINRDSKNSAAETETGYTKWSSDTTGGASSGLAAVTKSFTSATGEAITVSFAQTATSQSRGGTGLVSNWYQVGAQGTAKLVSDGLTVAPANMTTGGEMQMTITGLSAGHHTLLTYHNAWDAASALVSLAPIDVYVNGVLIVNDLQPTIRAATNIAAPIAYLEFDVADTSTVTTILFSTETSSTSTTKNVMINAFEIDTSNASRNANTPSPADADEHVNADSGSFLLSWSAALSGDSISRDVYFGTSRNAVLTATRTSPEFKGNQTALSYNVTGLNGHLTYYWRVDEIDSNGNVTKGTVWYFRPRLLAFPGAEGYGRFARGGRGGKVVHVTSLADYATAATPIPGTLRYAIEQETGPRTIVFDVSGLITLQSDIVISSAQPYITVAGQTAPGKGITIKRQLFGMSGASDVIVRFLRVLVGKESGETQNATGISGSNNVIMDHCSIGWGIDEGLSTRTAKNVTFQRCSLSEALNVAGHQNYPAGTAHGYAASVGGDIVSLHHNLLAHNEGRNWSMAGGLDAAGYYAGRLDIFNNVVYNWGGRTTDGGAHEVNFVNNYYKTGAATTKFTALNPQYGGFPGTQQYYMSGNVMPGRFDESNQAAGFTIGTENGGTLPQNSTPAYTALVNAPFFPSYATIHSAADAYKQVLSDVGCNQPQIDDRDIRIINETLNGTYTYTGSISGKRGLPDTTADVGGWENYPEMKRADNFDTDRDGMPDWWETLFGLNSRSAANDFSESNADLDNDGFTNLEDYLNWLALPRYNSAINGSVDIDLSALSRGYTSVPVFTLGTPTAGTVQLIGNGKTVRYTPAASFEGIARFSFTVTDSVGSTMTRDIGVRTYAIPDPTLALTRNATTFSNEFIGVPGQTYKIQYSDDLVTWIDLQTITATGEAYPFTVPTNLTGATRRFFRATSIP
ncbi:pectate lyase [Nibricoccus aquaticus]|uniref:Pectate lyase n=1 Tax=Nibricoccus aquaticus TaxID=2576891 RepID=A0A290QFD1_9BACT|nr:Ig-like domain-containing protein [Nibricoccus aquaticus]ATC63061.1 pectate lyase [Nibricoccus aquaticus]